MADYARYAGQALCYALFFLPIIYFSHLPEHTHVPPGMAELKLAVRHAGEIVGECTPVTTGAQGALPGNFQRPQICPRERSPLRLQVLLDGQTLYTDTVPASGLHNDGVSSIYRRFTVPAGAYTVQLRMADDVDLESYNWELERQIELEPAQVMVATFKDGFRLE